MHIYKFLLLILFASLYLAGLSSATDTSRRLVYTLTITTYLFVGTLSKLHSQPRCYTWSGFAIFGLGYILLSLFPTEPWDFNDNLLSAPLVRELSNIIHPRIQGHLINNRSNLKPILKNAHYGNMIKNSIVIIHCIISLLVATMGMVFVKLAACYFGQNKNQDQTSVCKS